MSATAQGRTSLMRFVVRPRWIVALVFALAIAAAFAWLGQWQLARAVESGTVVQRPTESVMPLTKAASVNGPVRTESVGQLASTTGSFVGEDYQLLHGRLNDGATGWWVVGHFTLAEPDAAGRRVEIAVARGWAPSKAAAQHAVDELSRQRSEVAQSITGRLLPSEPPSAPAVGADPHSMEGMSSAALFNLWHGVDHSDVYSGYIVEHGTRAAGLDAIYSPPPVEETTIDWLNVFYAAEWAIFAGFAVFLWYRVARDAWEREREDAEAAEAASATAADAP